MGVSEQLVKRFYRTTGVPALDQLIYGWPRRGLALIYGSQKAGKTTLALQASVTTAVEEDKVLMLDTESGGIGELRLYSLAQAMGVKEELIPRILSNITLLVVSWHLGGYHGRYLNRDLALSRRLRSPITRLDLWSNMVKTC